MDTEGFKLWAEGFVETTSGSRFNAIFVINNINYNFSGAFTSSVPPFKCRNATLCYNDIRELTSTRQFEGTLGPTHCSLNLANGPRIRGPLDMPLSPGSSVSGSGIWSQN